MPPCPGCSCWAEFKAVFFSLLCTDSVQPGCNVALTQPFAFTQKRASSPLSSARTSRLWALCRRMTPRERNFPPLRDQRCRSITGAALWLCRHCAQWRGLCLSAEQRAHCDQLAEESLQSPWLHHRKFGLQENIEHKVRNKMPASEWVIGGKNWPSWHSSSFSIVLLHTPHVSSDGVVYCLWFHKALRTKTRT